MQGISKLNSVIILATSVAVIYLIGIMLQLRLEWLYALYGLAVGVCIWMALRILRDPWSTDQTFDDYFYQDRLDIRGVGLE